MIETKRKPFAFIRCRHAKELDGSEQKALFYLWNGAALVLSSAGICVLSLLLGIGMMEVQFFFDYFRSPLLFLLNFLPVLLLQLLLFSVFGRQWLSFLVSSLVVLLASVVDFYKLKFRDEPFVFSDLSFAGTALGVIEKYDLTPNVRIILSVGAIIAGTLFLLFFVRGRLPGKAKCAAALVTLASVFPLWHFVYNNTAVYNSPATFSARAVTNWTQQMQVAKGFIYQFIFSIDDLTGHPPEGYDEDAVLSLLSEYSDCEIPSDERVNIIVFQLESFCDLEDMGVQGVSPRVYEQFSALKDESFHGRLIVNSFAGGTQDTERCFLTSSTHLLDYHAPAYSNVWYLRSQGYQTIGAHPYFKDMYNRGNVEKYLGFHEFWFSDDRYSELAGLEDNWATDYAFFPDITSEFIKRVHGQAPVFSYNITMQGHGAYVFDRYNNANDLWTGGDDDSPVSFVLNNYLSLVMDTGSWLRQTVDKLSKESEPIILIAYGDHKPNFSYGESNAYTDLGIDLSPATEEGFYNHFSTEYLIWANDSAKELFGNDFTGEGPTVSSGALMPLLFDKLGWHGSAYTQLASEVYRQIPVINSDGLYIENGVFCTTLSEDGYSALKNLEAVEYYLLHNFDTQAIK